VSRSRYRVGIRCWWASMRSGAAMSVAAFVERLEWGVTFDRHLDAAVREGHQVIDGLDRRNAEALLPRLRAT
jgi:hypothetical protein